MPDRSADWLAQAIRDLEQAEDSRKAGRHEWACFAAHQSAEKAIKALHLHLGQEAWGHVVARLLRDLPLEVPEEIVDRARILDNYYGKLQSEEAIRHASSILEFVSSQMAI